MDPTNQTQSNTEVLSNSSTENAPLTGLKPISVLLQDTIDLVKSRFINLVIVGLTGTALLWLISMFFTAVVMSNASTDGKMVPAKLFAGGNFMLWMIVVIPAIIVAGVFLYVSLCGVLKTNNIKTALSIGYSRTLPVVLFMFVFLFILFGAMLLLFLPVIPFYIFGLFALFVAVESNMTGFKAIFESYRLVKGNALGVVGRIIVLIFLVAVVTFVLSKIFEDTGPIAAIVSLFVEILVQVFMGCYLYAIYSNLRDVKPRPEGYTPSSLSKLLTYGVFILGILFIPLLLIINPVKHINRSIEKQMRQEQMRQIQNSNLDYDQVQLPELSQ